MQNTLIGGLLLLGGIWVSIKNNRTKGSILLITLLLIVSISLVVSLKPNNSSSVSVPPSIVMEHLENPPQPLPMPLEVPKPQASSASNQKAQPENIELKKTPNPPFTLIQGSASNTINNIQFVDTNNNVLYSGSNMDGTKFRYQCPSGTNIVGYEINNEGSDAKNSSIFGGFGPVYCADGTVIGSSVGKPQSQRVGQVPTTSLSSYQFVDSKSLAFDGSMMGTINDTNVEQCASMCTMLKDKCGGFTYNNDDKKCGLAYLIDSNKLQPNSNGRTYMKPEVKKN
jgi:hypothetical protein